MDERDLTLEELEEIIDLTHDLFVNASDSKSFCEKAAKLFNKLGESNHVIPMIEGFVNEI